MAPRTERVDVEDATFQHLETLRRNRRKRHRHREFVVEGVRHLDALRAHGWRVRAYAHPHDRPLSGWARDTLAASGAEVHYALPAALLAKLSARREGSELLAVVAMPDDDPARLPARDDLLLVLADRPGNPGNLGTLIRSCDALGAHGVIVTGHAVDLYDPETIAATTGSLFALPALRLPSHREAAALFARLRAPLPALQVVGTAVEAAEAVDALDLRAPTVLLLGNETRGLSRAYRDLCDRLAVVPMAAPAAARTASSLNVACAGTVLLYEAGRQRRART